MRALPSYPGSLCRSTLLASVPVSLTTPRPQGRGFLVPLARCVGVYSLSLPESEDIMCCYHISVVALTTALTGEQSLLDTVLGINMAKHRTPLGGVRRIDGDHLTTTPARYRPSLLARILFQTKRHAPTKRTNCCAVGRLVFNRYL